MSIKHYAFFVLKFPINLLKIIFGIIKILLNERTYRKGCKKNKIEVLTDLIIWALKYFEANFYYYHYGMNIKGAQKEGYIPKNKFMKIRNASNIHYSGNRKIDYVCLLSDKILFSEHLKGKASIPETIFYVRNGKINDFEVINIENIRNLISGNVKFILKDALGQEAGQIGVETNGVFLVEINKDGISINGRILLEKDFIKLLSNGNEWIAQELILQAEGIKELNPSSVNTIRLLTCNVDGEIKICKAVLKVGAKGEVVDNFWAGGVLLNIDINTGKFTGEYLFDHSNGTIDGVEHLVDATTGKPVTNWSSATAEAIKAHKQVSKIKSIGWDVAITEKGACIIEGNDNWDIVMFQAFEPLDEYLTEIIK